MLINNRFMRLNEINSMERKKMITTAQRSYLAGMHNPIIHSATVIIGWIKIFKCLPSVKEILCIIVHDIGYLKQKSIDGKDNHHPELGAQMCGKLLGSSYYNLCIAHSRDYAKQKGLPLSKLGYADKYSVLAYPDGIFKYLIKFGGEAEEYHKTTKTKKWGFPVQVELIKAQYRKWVNENCASFNMK